MWETIRRWLIGDLGIQGEFQYQAIHLNSVLAVAAACLIVALIGRSHKRLHKRPA